jgi:hypothetical protein
MQNLLKKRTQALQSKVPVISADVEANSPKPAGKKLSNIMNQVKNKTKKKKDEIKLPNVKYTIPVEVEDSGLLGIKFYYDNVDDFDKYNLKIIKRPWIIKNNGKLLQGIEVFNDAMYYRTGDMAEYVKKYYIDYFKNQSLETPFGQNEENINRTLDEIKGNGQVKIQPHQKFASTYISNLTDFNSMLIYHTIGSGKTVTSILIGESNKGMYISKGGKLEMREGGEIPQKVYRKNKNKTENDIYVNEPCHITLVVPKQIQDQYYQEIRGSIENNEIKSFTGECVIYSEDPNFYENEGMDKYIYYRQFYTGTVDADGKPRSPLLMKLDEVNKSIAEINREKIDEENRIMEEGLVGGEDEKNYAEILTKLSRERKELLDKLNEKINDVYIIVTHETFLNRIMKGEKREESNITNYVVDDFLFGNKKNDMPHPDCRYSKKSVVIIDEIHKLATAGGTNSGRLHDFLNIYARDPVSGQPRLKVIGMTGTPVFDNPHESALIVNFFRPRIPMPLSRIMFDRFFIDTSSEMKDSAKIKNKICFQYLMSGYVSYSQGANPKGFPIRRTKIMLHKMGGYQFQEYKKSLQNDLSLDIESEKYIEKSGFFDIYKTLPDDGQQDDGKQGRYLKSRELCNIAFPDNTKGDEIESLASKLLLSRGSNILESLKTYSMKYYNIIKQIIESSKNDEGPIVVYSEWVLYGILPLMKVLELLGWRLLNEDVLNKTDESVFNETLEIENRIENNSNGYGNFAVWSSQGQSYYGIKNENYTKKIQNLFNSPRNKDGKIIKVIFTTVEEGVSFKRVKELHILSSWWNYKRLEQVSGRGERFLSHSDLPEEKQYIDIYFHCSVFDTYYNYPKLNNEMSAMISSVFSSKNNNKKSSITNYKDMARLTIEQKVYITARRKNSINLQFEKAIKETAIDNELNKYNNLIRFEEIIFPQMDIKNIDMYPDDKILYNRTDDKYYYYQSHNQIYNLKLYTTFEENGQLKPIWPPFEGEVGELININDWSQCKIEEIKSDNSEKLVSFIITEDVPNFNDDPNIKNKNFKELMNYAVKEKGEELDVWEYFNNKRIKKELYELMVGLYKIPTGMGSVDLSIKFYQNLFNEKNKKVLIDYLVRNKGPVYLLENFKNNLGNSTVDKKLKNTITSILPTLESSVKKVSESQANGDKERIIKMFHQQKTIDITNKMKQELITKFHISSEYINMLNPIDIERIYFDQQLKSKKS